MHKEKSILGEYASNKLFEWLFSRVLATHCNSMQARVQLPAGTCQSFDL